MCRAVNPHDLLFVIQATVFQGFKCSVSNLLVQMPGAPPETYRSSMLDIQEEFAHHPTFYILAANHGNGCFREIVRMKLVGVSKVPVASANALGV